MGGMEAQSRQTEDTMEREHAFAEENLPAFVLGALDEDESARVQEHLKHCPQCQSAYRSYERVATALAYAVPQVDPPPYLRQMIRALTIAPPSLSHPSFARRDGIWQRLGRMPRLFLAVAILLALGMAGWNISLHQRLSAMQAEMVSAHEVGEVLMNYMSNPSAYDTYVIAGEAASPSPRALVVRDRVHGRFLVVLDDLPIEAGAAYLIWLVDATGRRIPVKKVRCDGNGRAVLMFESPMPMDMIRGLRITPVDQQDASPVLDGRFPLDEGYPSLLALDAL